MALFRRRPPTVLTAAASVIRDPQSPSAKSRAPDAEYLFNLYSNLGAIHAAMRAKHGAASKITYYAAQVVDQDLDPEPVLEGPAADAFDALQGPGGDFGNFIAEMAMQWDIVGEGFLVGQDTETGPEWDVWSAVEYSEKRQGLRVDLDEDAVTAIQGTDFVMRSWRSHPMRRQLPDSPMRSVVRQCEQYLAFGDMLTALAQSRLVAPIFITPSEMDFPATDSNGNAQTFGSWLMKAMSAAVADSQNANRLTPITLEVPYAMKDGFTTLDLTRALEEWVPEVMQRILTQIAIGLDLPAEIVTGMADLNHWGAWLTDDSLRLNYVDPLVLDVLDSFTRGYLWPNLQAAGVPNFRDFLFWRDYSDLTSRTITAADALASFQEGLISSEAARRSIGFTETDAPTEDEVTSTPDPLVVENPGIPVMEEVITAAASRETFADIDHRLYSKLSEAAQAALDRSLERAGQRIRSKVQGDTRNNRSPEFKVMADAVFGIDPIHVAMTLGRDAVYALGFGEQELVPDDAFDRFGKRAEVLLTQGQSQTRSLVRKETGAEVTESDERSWVDKAVAFLISGLVLYARSKLFTPDLTPDPAETGEVPDTDVPASMVFDTMTLAGDGTLGVFEERGLATGAYGQTLVHDAGFSVQERVWSVGAPKVPFEPHHNLNGFRFERWTDERLRPPVSASWLGVDFMHPSDHRGCVCAADLIIKEAD